VKNKNTGIPLKGWKFAGWEGGLAPAQDRMPFNVEFTIQPANLHLRKVSLALSDCLTLNSQFETEWHSIWSGGKPTFPTCEFPLLEWYPRSISISSQLLPWVGFQTAPVRTKTTLPLSSVHRPDWVLMDIDLPEVDGINATRQIVAAHPEARVVIVTSYDDAGLRETARSAGACEYVVKENLIEIRCILAAHTCP